MVRRPFKDRRPLGPFITESDGSDTNKPDENNINQGRQSPTFESIDDLPDSPMLREYIHKQSEYFGVEPEEIINSKPVEDYMRRLGVWEQALKENS